MLRKSSSDRRGHLPKDTCLSKCRAGVHTLTESIPGGCGLGLDAVLPGELHPLPPPQELSLALPKGLSSWVAPHLALGPRGRVLSLPAIQLQPALPGRPQGLLQDRTELASWTWAWCPGCCSATSASSAGSLCCADAAVVGPPWSPGPKVSRSCCSVTRDAELS